MIQITRGNIVKADAEALVNTVNTVGFMGKGIALQFKKAFPENFRAYQRACNAGQVRPGHMFVYETGSLVNPKFIINFPTKRHWRGNSRLEDIQSGLRALIQEVRDRHIVSIAIPPLGCGNGGLEWRVVRPMIETAFAETPHVHVQLYEPVGAPTAQSMPIGTARPRITTPRALIIRLMRQYGEMSYRLTLLEIQKLAYFLQESGEQLQLRYQQGLYGPYAHNLNKVLETLEGHYTRGYGDSQRPDVEIELLPEAEDRANAVLASDPASLSRLAKVASLIEGFETPYGMELLASVHWVACHGVPPARTSEDAIVRIHSWNDRKRYMFKPEHIRVAWRQLAEQGWLSAPSQAQAPAIE
ncbi:MAG: macro domain-containing protein [Chloroflexi bacterium]|nr:macro domain-containing protein [Chloroflexota bacterium]